MSRKTLKIIGTIFMVLLTISMFVYAHPSASEFATAFFLNIFLYLKLKLPMIIIGLILSLKKFVLGLTAIKVFFIGIKRYVIDHIISTNLNEHFFVHLLIPLKEWWKNFDLKKKLFFFIPASILSVLTVYLTGLSKFLNFVGIKALIISFFKGVWLVFNKIFFFFTSFIWDSWFAPIIEVLIFSWLLKLLEKIPVIRKIFNKIYAFFATILSRMGAVQDDYVNKPIQKRLNHAGRRAALYLKKRNRAQKKIIKEQQALLKEYGEEKEKTP
jgi:hypothetical protein